MIAIGDRPYGGVTLLQQPRYNVVCGLVLKPTLNGTGCILS